MKINEIQRLEPKDVTTSTDEIKVKNYGSLKTKPLPGGAGYLYAEVENGPMYDIYIIDPDKPSSKPTENGKPTPGLCVAQMQLLRDATFPDPKAYSVKFVEVIDAYKSRGLGKALYGVALYLAKLTLIAGDKQTPSGRKQWVSLTKINGVEVKGYVMVEAYATDDEDLIDSIESDLYAERIGKGKYGEIYFSFDLKYNGTELESDPPSKINLYSNEEQIDDYVVGMFAKWKS